MSSESPVALLIDDSGTLLATAVGTPSTAAITVQGDPSGTPIPVTSTSPSTGVNNSAPPGFSTQIGGTDGTNLHSVRVYDTDTGAGTQYVLGTTLRKSAAGGSVEAGTASDPLRIDPTGTTTQPVSGTVSVGNFPSTQAVSGTVSVSNFPATQPVSAVSLPLPTGAATETTLATLLSTSAFQARINTLGQKTSANSTPVVLASDQSSIPVSVGNFPATQPISATSLPLPTGAATETTLATLLTASTFTARVNTLGQKTSANSTPVVLASDQSAIPITGSVTATNGSIGSNGSAIPTSSTEMGGSDGTNLQAIRVFDADTGAGAQYILGVGLRKFASGGSVEAGTSSDPLRIDPTGTTTQPVSGTVTANIGTTNGLALDATLTGGSQKSVVRGGAKGTTTAADVTSTAEGANNQALDVQIWHSGTAINPTAIRALTSADTVTIVPSGTQTVSGSVSVSNFPATQPVSGTVSVSNFPATQPVSGTVTANIGTTNGLALDATLTGGTTKAVARGGAKGATTSADVTSTAEGTDHQALDVQLYSGGTAINPTQIRALTSSDTVTIVPSGTQTVSGSVSVSNFPATQPVSATSLPLPTGAATETTLATLLTSSTFTARINTLGQKTMANSTPVVLASDQSSLSVTVSNFPATQPVSGTVTSNQGTAAALSGAWPVKITDGTNSMPTGDAVGRAIFHKITDGTNTATVKPASTAAVASDPALVVTLSPNNPISASISPQVVGTHANAWSAAAVALNGVSSIVDCQYVTHVSIFGTTSGGTTISVLYSQDNTNFYAAGTISAGTGDWGGDFTVGARYVRLRSSNARTITATISGKG
jgi:hypothetical protein